MTFSLFILLTFFVIGRPQDFFIALASLRPALVLTIIVLGMTFLGSGGKTINAAFGASQSKRYALFYLMMILSIPLAVHRRIAFEYTFLVYLSNMLYYYIFIINVDSVKKLKRIVFVICISILFYSALSLANGSFSSGRFFFGTMYDPNDLAYFLVSLFPLSIFYVVHNEGRLKKILGLITIGVSVITILITGSRGGLLGLVALSVMFMFSKSVNIKLSVKVIPFIVGIIVLLAFGSKINTERYATLTQMGGDYNVTGEMGRFGIWKRGLGFIVSNPITGVGVNCFPVAIGTERAEIGEIPKWQVAHNSYLQIGAETGLPGIFLFGALIAGSLKIFSHYGRSTPSSSDADEMAIIAGLLRVAFVGSLISAFFLTQGYSMLFTLFFAFAVVLKNIAIPLPAEPAKNNR